MLRIVVNIDKKDVTITWTIGQVLPQVNGKLIRLEASGAELRAIAEKKNLPVSDIDVSCIIWHGRLAGKTLSLVREIAEEHKP